MNASFMTIDGIDGENVRCIVERCYYKDSMPNTQTITMVLSVNAFTNVGLRPDPSKVYLVAFNRDGNYISRIIGIDKNETQKRTAQLAELL